jgi:hypothetical protein
MAKKLFLKNLQTTKTIFSATLITLLLISLIALFSPPATAHEPPLSIPSYAYIIAFPNPVGVGQPISLFAWTATYPPTAQGEYGDHWLNLTINVMQPDGTNTTLGPFESDPVGTIFTTYTPTEAGNYTFQFIMPAYTMTGTNPQFPVTPPSSVTGAAYINDTFEAALSTPVTVVATDEPIPGPPNYPLPTDY